MTRKPTFFWQGLLIVLPVLLLAGVGIVSLWKDRETVTLDARRAAEQYGEQLAAFLTAEFDLAPENLPRLLVSDAEREERPMDTGAIWPDPATPYLWVHGSIIDREGNLISVGPHGNPGDYPRFPSATSFPAEKLEGRAAELWTLATTVELTDHHVAIEVYEEFLALEPAEPFYSNATYARAILLSATGQNETALEDLRALQGTAELTETGLPLATLAQFQRVNLLSAQFRGGNTRETRELQSAIRDLCSQAVKKASFGTASLLSATADVVEQSGHDYLMPIRHAQMTWLADENTRSFHQSLKSLLAAHLGRQQPFWTEWNHKDRLVVPVPVGQGSVAGNEPEPEFFQTHVYSAELLQRALERLLKEAPIVPPDSIKPTIHLHERSVSDPYPNDELLATVESDWRIGQTSIDGLQVALHLVHPDLLYAQQRQRALWFGALILIAAAAAVIGYATAHRAFHRQLYLNEMKSNFVASVSHELRAPIASVRLMAEGLERGAVQQPEKQRDYFKFIVQECRRLSSLIENVLDFSRIEQGRREYEFEPTDVVRLVQHTAELMHPCALERHVSIETTVDPQLACLNPHPELDGKAIQQALVNLIDNAIKHSPANAAVVVRISAEDDANSILLSVEDCGEGIPADEHARIFERFYRLGSELRRETKGAGIGLSIVKHIVEAHGGEVRVHSTVGKGSRFLIKIPFHVPDSHN